MAPRRPPDLTKPPTRDDASLAAIAKRWGPAAVERLYAHLPSGTVSTYFASRGALAWVRSSPPTGSALFVHAGSDFTQFRGASMYFTDTATAAAAFTAILADAQVDDIAAAQSDIIAAFADVSGGDPILTQSAADALLAEVRGRSGTGADPKAIALFEPPHFEGRQLAFVVTFRYRAELVRVVVDGDSLAARVEPLGRSQRHMMPVG